MAARATRSTSGSASRTSDDDSRCLLLALSHDVLGVIVDGLADPLQPVVAVAFSSTCLGLRTPLRAALEVLKERHARAVALCRKAKRRWFGMELEMNCAELRDQGTLEWQEKDLTADHMATLGMILQTNGLPKLVCLVLSWNGFADAGMLALCKGLGRGAVPSLRTLSLARNHFGPEGAEALAAALRRGAMPRLKWLALFGNPIGNQGVVALAAPLRKMPALERVALHICGIGDEGVASLVTNLGKDDFKALEHLDLEYNQITEAGGETLVAAVNGNALQSLKALHILNNDMSDEAAVALKAKLEHNFSRRDAIPVLRLDNAMTSATSEVEAFLATLGLEQYAQTLIYNGFYTSVDALRTADYHELLECNVRPVHARLIISNLRGGGTPVGSSSGSSDGVVTFLRSIGLENCTQQVLEAGFTSLEALSDSSMNALLEAGLKPVHARLITSNLDSAASAGLAVGQPPRNDEDEALAPLVPVSLAPALDEEAASKPRSLLKCVLCCVLLIAAAVLVPSFVNARGTTAVADQTLPPPPPSLARAAPPRRPKGGRRGKRTPAFPPTFASHR